MKSLSKMACIFMCVLLITGCEKNEEILTTESEKHLDTSKGKKPNVNICHQGKIINVNANALKGHLKHGDVQLIDADGDGYVTEANDCGLPVDCDDTNAAINPGAEEIPYNGLDDDCDPATLDDDLDQDGYDLADDCDDTNAAINPGAPEICDDGIDNNCNNLIDCEDEACATQSVCSACEVISQELFDMVGELAVGPFNGTGILRITTNASFIRYSLQFITSGFVPEENRNVTAQMRITVFQFSGSSNYTYSLNGAFFDKNGIFVIPNDSGTTSDGQFSSCADTILNFAQDRQLTIENN